MPSDSDDDSDGEGGRGEGTTESRRDAALAGGKSKAATIKPSRQARIEDAELLKPWELKRREYKQKRKMTAKRDKSTLAAMQAFSQKLAAAAKSSPALVPAPAAEKESVPLVALPLTHDGPLGVLCCHAPACPLRHTHVRLVPRATVQLETAGGSYHRCWSCVHDQTIHVEICQLTRVFPAEQAYNGEVRTDIDQAALMPAAWRIDALQVPLHLLCRTTMMVVFCQLLPLEQSVAVRWATALHLEL